MTKAIKLKPDVIITIGMDEIPLPSDYGAAEMKFFIRRNTYKGAFITFTLLLLVLMMNCVMDSVDRAAADIKVAPITKLSIEDLPPPDMDATDIAPPPEVIINTGPAARAGNPVPVPDAMIAPDLQDFATIDVIDRAAAAGGTGEDLGGFAGNIDWDKDRVETNKLVDREPDHDEFVPVEKEPDFDLRKLQGLVVYPEMARRAGIEGTVRIRALVDRTGKITRTMVELSDNRALDQAALKAVQDYGYATPAVMNNQPTSCWVTVPIVFRLR
jgi:TonB family protein